MFLLPMKLISTELSEGSIQLTYTDGQSADSAAQLLVVRVPSKLDPKKSMLWNQMNAMNELAEWAGQESRRLRNELEKI